MTNAHGPEGLAFWKVEGAGNDFVLVDERQTGPVLTAAQREKLENRGMLDWSAARAFAERIITAFDVRTPGPANAARSLSGGNLQKYVIGREVLQRPEVLVVNQPTWGVDAGSAAAIQKAILDLAAGGAAVVVISQDLDELFAIADRVAVMSEGRLSPALPIDEADIQEIGLLMGGIHGAEPGGRHDPA